MSIAELTSRTIAISKQSGLGATSAPGDAAQYQNFRPDTTGGLEKESFESDSIRRDAQYSNPRHGLRQANFTLSQELQIGGHNQLFAALLRAAWAAGGASASSADRAFNATNRTITRTAGSFITDGFKVGDIIRAAGYAAGGNNGKNFRLTSVTATVLTFADDAWLTGLVTEAAGANVTLSTPGQKLQVPSSGHTKDYFTIEDFHSDISQSTLINDAIVNSAEIDVAPGAHATVNFNMLGLNADLDGTAEYFTGPPSAAPTGALLAGPEGKLRYDDADSTVMTQITLSIDSGGEVKAVIGANVSPDAFRLGVRVTGSLGALFDGGAILDNFDDETEAGLMIYLFADSTASSAFLAIKLPNAKINSASKAADGPAQTISGDFSAGKYVGASTVIEGSTIVLQDSSVS